MNELDAADAIILTPAEMLSAAIIGVARHIAALQKNLNDVAGNDGENGWQIHIEGACGELVVAKRLGIFWGPSINTFKEGADVANKFQVRTRSKHEYELIVRPKDKQAIWILVTGIAPKYVVRGWVADIDARKEAYLKNYGGRPEAFFIPHNVLHSLDELKDFLK